MNRFEPRPGLVCIGQPTREEALEILKNVAPKLWLNLRTHAESGQIEHMESLVSSHGGDYLHIPTRGQSDISFKHAELIQSKIEAIYDGSIVLQCGSSNRVGALLALQHFQKNQDADAAIRYGKNAGLSGLEEKVRALLV